MDPSMRCQAARLEIDEWLATGTPPGAAAMAHMGECAQCRHAHAEAQLNWLLAAHRVPPARPGFADEAIDRAIHHSRALRAEGADSKGGLRWLAAIAASMAVVAMVLGALVANGPRASLPSGSIAQVVMGPLQGRIVQVLIDSADDRDSATITISLADNLELEGFPGERVIEWNTPLKAGKNLLALPLRLTDGDPSHFDVAFSHGEVHRKVRIDVSVAEPGPLPPA